MTLSWPKGRSIRSKSFPALLDQLMGDAAAVVLRGYRLPTDCQLVRPGQHYFDERGEAMWTTVTRLVAELEKEAAA